MERIPVSRGKICICIWIVGPEGRYGPPGAEIFGGTQELILQFERAQQHVVVQCFHVAAVNPNGAHYYVGLGAVFLERLRSSPHMMRQVGGAIAQIRGIEKRKRVYEDRGNSDGDDESRDDVSRGISTVSRECSAERMVRGKGWSFRCSKARSVRTCITMGLIHDEWHQPRSEKRRDPYPRKGYKRYQIICGDGCK